MTTDFPATSASDARWNAKRLPLLKGHDRQATAAGGTVLSVARIEAINAL